MLSAEEERYEAALAKYGAARSAYESAVQGVGPRMQARLAMDQAASALLDALIAMQAARRAAVPPLETLLADPETQVDPDSTVLGALMVDDLQDQVAKLKDDRRDQNFTIQGLKNHVARLEDEHQEARAEVERLQEQNHGLYQTVLMSAREQERLRINLLRHHATLDPKRWGQECPVCEPEGEPPGIENVSTDDELAANLIRITAEGGDHVARLLERPDILASIRHGGAHPEEAVEIDLPEPPTSKPAARGLNTCEEQFQEKVAEIIRLGTQLEERDAEIARMRHFLQQRWVTTDVGPHCLLDVYDQINPAWIDWIRSGGGPPGSEPPRRRPPLTRVDDQPNGG